MTDIRRRNMVVGLGTIVFGTSGFIASGAFEVGSEGSAGSNWIRVEGTDVALDPEGGEGDVSPDTDADDDDDSDEADDDSNDTDGDDDPSGSSDDGGTPEDESEEEELDGEEIEEEEEVYTLSIRRLGDGSFSVSPNSPFTNQGTNIPYRAGTSVTVRARAGEGHAFVGWSGDVAGTDSPQVSVTMDRDRRITGRFERTEEELEEEELEEEEEFDEEELEDEEEEEEGDDDEEDDDDDGSGSSSPSPSPPDDGEDADPTKPTRVQVVTDPFNDGNLLTRQSHRWNGTMSGSELVESDGNGFFTGFSVDDANRNAVSRIGVVDGNGVPTDRFAFLISNVGNPDSPGTGGRPVDLRVDLLDEDGSVMGSTPQLSFPYRIVTADGSTVGSGPDLLDETVRLSVPNVIEVAIEIDSRTGTEDVERIAAVRFAADPAGGS